MFILSHKFMLTHFLRFVYVRGDLTGNSLIVNKHGIGCVLGQRSKPLVKDQVVRDSSWSWTSAWRNNYNNNKENLQCILHCIGEFNIQPQISKK